MLLVEGGVFADWANDVVAAIRPTASVDSNKTGFMMYLLQVCTMAI
jgi:hypothetical protein